MSGNAKKPSKDLIAMLVCPMTRTKLIYDEDAQELINKAAGFAYPIQDGVPIMLIEKARLLDSN